MLDKVKKLFFSGDTRWVYSTGIRLLIRSNICLEDTIG